MNIPDEAVEAAITAWDKIETRMVRGRMREALEAAAPYLKADAWDECEAAKYLVMLKADGSGLTRVKTNPYRSQA